MLLLLWAAVAAAQTTPVSVQANGSGTIMVTPDKADLSVGVVTQGSTAQEAAQQNATKANAMIAALKQVLGTSGTVQTISYYISPRYTSAQPPVIVGYTASNTVRVTTSDLNLVGPLIDAANAAGANDVSGISYGLADEEPVRQQALTKAAQQALAHAAAIAGGLGRKTGAVLSAQEGSAVIPYNVGLAAAGAASTPIQTGTVTVTATVTATVALQ
jgi:hypothetical protein